MNNNFSFICKNKSIECKEINEEQFISSIGSSSFNPFPLLEGNP